MRHFLKALSFVVSLLPATLCAAENMNVTTWMSHYRLCNGKRRNKNAVCGPMQIRFHRGNGDTNITN